MTPAFQTDGEEGLRLLAVRDTQNARCAVAFIVTRKGKEVARVVLSFQDVHRVFHELGDWLELHVDGEIDWVRGAM